MTSTGTVGQAPHQFQRLTGIPPGLSLSPQGVLAGTPTTVGSFGLRIQVTDAADCVGQRIYTLDVVP